MATLLRRVQCADEALIEIAHRIPEAGLAGIVWGSMASVQEHQAAVFFRDGQVLEVLGPGRYVLSPALFPHLASEGVVAEDESAFEAAVYFVTQRVLAGVEWESTHPATFHDPELGRVELRASGVYTMRVSDPARFIDALAGSEGKLVSSFLDSYIKEAIAARFDDLLGRRLTNLIDLPAFYNEFAAETRLELREDFALFGVDLIDFFLTSVVPTEDAQQALDARGGARGSTISTPRFGTSPGIQSSGSNGLGVGSGMRLVLPQAFIAPGASASGPCPGCQEAPEEGSCTACHKPVPRGASYCPSCGTGIRKR